MSKDPFKIHEIPGFTTGMLAITKQPATASEFTKIDTWNPDCVVTLTTEAEFPNDTLWLPQKFLKAPHDWLHLPVADFGVPQDRDRELWQDAMDQLAKILKTDGRLLAHCKGGNGRSGMLILRLLTMQGEDGQTALNRLRAVRLGAVETDAQYAWATKPL